jgi:hypothetical protein
MPSFRKEIMQAINRCSVEGRSNTPDFILAGYLADCLLAFDRASNARESWYGVRLHPGLEKEPLKVGDAAGKVRSPDRERQAELIIKAFMPDWCAWHEQPEFAKLAALRARDAAEKLFVPPAKKGKSRKRR